MSFGYYHGKKCKLQDVRNKKSFLREHREQFAVETDTCSSSCFMIRYKNHYVDVNNVSLDLSVAETSMQGRQCLESCSGAGAAIHPGT